MKKLSLLTVYLFCLLQGNLIAQDNQIWERRFGNSSINQCYGVCTVADGIVAVGVTDNFNTPGWEGITGKGGQDGTIVKLDNYGNTIWKNNFGGLTNDCFYKVTMVPDGVVAVGYSSVNSFGNGDWEGIESKGGLWYGLDAIIVKYDNNGNVVWKKNFGSSCDDIFWGVTTVSDGVIAVGSVGKSTFANATGYCPDGYGNGDWEGIQPKGLANAIIVKYDNDGNVVWKNIFGGCYSDQFMSVTAVSDGIVAVGYSWYNSFGTGDWTNVVGNGDIDAITVKYDNDGNVIWKKNYGSTSCDRFYSVTTVPDGVVAVGDSWYIVPGIPESAIVVKYNNDGNLIWEDNFAGKYNGNEAWSVSTLQDTDEVIVVGNSEGAPHRGQYQILLRKYDSDGNVVWENNKDNACFNIQSVATVSNGFIISGRKTNPGADAYIAKSTYQELSVLTGMVFIIGNTVFGQALYAIQQLSSILPGNLGDLTYQWKRSGTPVGTNDATYILSEADINHTLTVTVTASNCIGSVTSDPTSIVTKATQDAPPAPTLNSKTDISITLNVVSGCEYNINGGT